MTGKPDGRRVPLCWQTYVEKMIAGCGAQTQIGYRLVYCPFHPAATPNGYVREHRLIAERHLGRFLLPGECVHHINGDRADNRPENLVVFPSNSAHIRHHSSGDLSEAVWFIEEAEVVA